MLGVLLCFIHLMQSLHSWGMLTYLHWHSEHIRRKALWCNGYIAWSCGCDLGVWVWSLHWLIILSGLFSKLWSTNISKFFRILGVLSDFDRTKPGLGLSSECSWNCRTWVNSDWTWTPIGLLWESEVENHHPFENQVVWVQSNQTPIGLLGLLSD